MRQAIGRIYDDVETGLWACLIAALIFFVVLFVPHASELRARAEGVRAQEIAAENRQLCEQLGKLSGTHEHVTCILDMQAFRAKIEKRIEDRLL
jgi:hypothetical protein